MPEALTADMERLNLHQEQARCTYRMLVDADKQTEAEEMQTEDATIVVSPETQPSTSVLNGHQWVRTEHWGWVQVKIPEA